MLVRGKSAFFSCNVVSKHIWEAGMGMQVTCRISVNKPLPSPPLTLKCVFLGSCRHECLFNTCFYFSMGGDQKYKFASLYGSELIYSQCGDSFFKFGSIAEALDSIQFRIHMVI